MKKSSLIIFIIALVICCAGIMSIYSTTYQKEGELLQMTYQRQIVWVILGLIAFFIISNFHYHRLWDAAYMLYIFAIFLLLLVWAVGAISLGAQRWLRFWWFNFQPSEISKLVIVIFLARYFSSKSVDSVSLLVGKSGIMRGLVLPFIFVFVPVALIIEQPDLGSGMMILVIFMIMMYLAGVKLRYLVLFLLLALFAMPVFWHFLRSYQQERLMVFLNPQIDPLGAGYTVIQSKIAIGSGGLFGKGWLSGTQSQLRFLPEAHTDFIFATFAEERGLFGSGILLLLYYFLITEGVRIALRTNDHFGKLFALGITLLLGTQVFINIAMNLGLAPVVGLPLPLMSYGGSSVVTTFIALGILVNIDRQGGVF